MVQLIGKTWAAFLLLVAGLYQQATAAPGSTFCTEIGRFPHPDDCDRYIDCIPNGDGTFKEHVKTCHRHPFSPEELRCVEGHLVPSCTPRSLRQAALPELNFLCTEGVTSVCHNCRMAVDCIDGTAYLYPCDSDQVCDLNTIFGGAAVCLPDITPLEVSPECLCPGPGMEIKADSFNSSMYLVCSSGNEGIPEVRYCGDGRIYDEETKTCGSEDTCGPSPSFPACESMGSFVHPQNCSWGYTCLYSSGVWEVSTECCPNQDDIFDPSQGSCQSACTTLDEPFKLCTDVGFVVDPVDCTKYYVCAVVGEPPLEEKTCLNGKMYSTDDNACVLECDRNPLSHCVRPDTC